MDSSTIDQIVSIEVEALCRHKNAIYVDAPVSGGVGGAQAGTLTFMVGSGDNQKTFERSKMFLQHMGKNIVSFFFKSTLWRRNNGKVLSRPIWQVSQRWEPLVFGSIPSKTFALFDYFYLE